MGVLSITKENLLEILQNELELFKPLLICDCWIMKYSDDMFEIDMSGSNYSLEETINFLIDFSSKNNINNIEIIPIFLGYDDFFQA